MRYRDVSLFLSKRLRSKFFFNLPNKFISLVRQLFNKPNCSIFHLTQNLMTQTSAPGQLPRKGIDPIVIIGALFFIFGFVTWLNSLLIPYLEIACELTKFQSFFVTFAFYIAYLVMAPI